MSQCTSEVYLPRLSDFIASHLGLHFPKKRWRDLDRGMGLAAAKLGFENSEACARWLLSYPVSQQHIEVLASILTVGETYFFRDIRGYEALSEQILPNLIASRRRATRRLSIWSAGCATGEEPYSIAMHLDRSLPDLRAWDISILGTDINPLFLKKGQEGLYGEWSFRGAAPDLRDRYFVPVGNRRFRVVEHIRKMVTFGYLNLVEDLAPSVPAASSEIDVIFCRNVLMYFSAAAAKKTARLFHRLLRDGGWLIVSPGEASQTIFADYETVRIPGAILFRKQTTPAVVRARRTGANHGARDTACGTHAADARMGIELPPIPKVDTRLVTGTRPVLVTRSGDKDSRPPCRPPEDRSPEPPGEGPGLYLEASDLLERGLHKEAAEKALALVRLEGSEARGMALLARAYANGGEKEKALEWCEKAIAAEKFNVTHYYLLATVLQEMGQVDASARTLRQALYLDRDFVPAHVALGVISRKRGSSELAEKCFKNALEILESYDPEAIVPESGGMTARVMMEAIRFSAGKED